MDPISDVETERVYEPEPAAELELECVLVVRMVRMGAPYEYDCLSHPRSLR